MPGSKENPLLTFAIAALNQEQFIREAIGGAFAQTYSPLEIVLSDDHSEDRTFEIMKEMAAAYHGPHRVILNQNPRRRCIGGHINRIIEISSGELIVGAAGDDVSLPERTTRAWQVWEDSNRQATSIYSNFIQINEAGAEIEQRLRSVPAGKDENARRQQTSISDYVKTLQPVVFGCSHTFSRELFRRFGNLPESLIHEDTVLGLRSFIAGQVFYVSQSLVKYRVHGNNIYVTSGSRGGSLAALEKEEARLKRYFGNKMNMFEAFVPDLEKAHRAGWIDARQFELALAYAHRTKKRYELLVEFLDAPFGRKCRIMSSLPRLGVRWKDWFGLMKRLLPRPVFIRLRYALAQTAFLKARLS